MKEEEESFLIKTSLSGRFKKLSMIVLIAPELDVPNETEIIEQLFEAGLKYYHLRKPNKNKSQLEKYIKQIDSKYYKNIIIHQYHGLAKDLGLKGIHLQEQFRLDLGEELQEYIKEFKVGKYTVSSSFHHPDTIEASKEPFDYHLLSPIFDAISKKGYKGKGFDVNHIAKKIIGMGGVTAANVAEVKEKGFQGIGILGSVWNSQNPLQAFQQIQNKIVENEEG